MAKKFSQFDTISNTDSTTYMPVLTGTILANKKISADNFVAPILEQITGINTSLSGKVDKTSPLTLKQKLIGNDTPTALIGTPGVNCQTISVINFKQKTFVYFIYDNLEGVANVQGAEYDAKTFTAYNVFEAVGFNILGDNNLNCSYAFVCNSKVYMLVNSYTVSGCYLLESVDGVTFTIVSDDLADVASNFKESFYGNHCLVPYRIDGYYYWFIEGRNPGESLWVMKLLKSTSLTTGWELVGLVDGLTYPNGARGGADIKYNNGTFKLFYHYTLHESLPSMLGYAESDINDPLHFSIKYYPLLGITRTPFPHTDQIADPTIVEINGKTYMFAEYMDNWNRLGKLYGWESPYRINDILNSPLTDMSDMSIPSTFTIDGTVDNNPSFIFSKLDEEQMIVSWEDGEFTVSTDTGLISFPKSTAIDSVMIVSVWCFGNYNLTQNNISVAITSAELNNSILAIGERAFENCVLLKSVIISDSVVDISPAIFNQCTSLENVKLGAGCTYLSDNMFNHCTSLETIVFPNTITEIKNNALVWCASLKNVTLSSNLEIIGGAVFAASTSIIDLYIPNSVITIDATAFNGMSPATTVTIPSRFDGHEAVNYLVSNGNIITFY